MDDIEGLKDGEFSPRSRYVTDGSKFKITVTYSQIKKSFTTSNCYLLFTVLFKIKKAIKISLFRIQLPVFEKQPFYC